MPLPNIFGTIATGAQEPGSALDQNFAALGALITLPCTATGTNAITLTPFVNTPSVSAYANFLRFSWLAGAVPTGAVTVQFSTLAALPLYLLDGVTQVTSGGLAIGQYLEIAYNAALNSGGGGFFWLNPTAGASGASMVLLSTATASNVATVSFTGSALFSATYDQFMVMLTNVVPVTSGSSLQLVLSENAGSTWLSANYAYALNYLDSNNAPTTLTSNSAAFIAVVGGQINSANQGAAGFIQISQPSSASSVKCILMQLSYQTPASRASITGAAAYLGDGNAINGMRFQMSSGNISSGNFALYAMRKQ